MEINPKISVILPVYNTEKYLFESISSVLNQNFTNFELIIVNDGSTDDSLKIAKEFEKKDKRVIVINKMNGGRADSINEAIKIIKGKYVTFQDADDIMYSERLKKQFEFMEKNKEVFMSYGNMIIFWEEEKREEIYISPEFDNPLELLKNIKQNLSLNLNEYRGLANFLDKKEYIPGPSVILRREIFDNGIKLDKRFDVGEDYDLWFQIIGKGYKIKKQDIIALMYRRHKNQITLTKKEKRAKSVELSLDKLKNNLYFY